MNLDATSDGVRDTAGSYALTEAGGEAVPAGYKRTEMGVIPEEWRACPMRDLLVKGRLGGNYPNQDIETSAPLMKMGNLGRGQFDVSKIEYVREGIAVEAEHLLRLGDVLFNTRNTLDLVGKVALWRDELPLAYYNSNLMRFEFDKSQICSSEYANYALNSSTSIKSLRALATGTTSVAAIYTRDLMSFLLPVPTSTEQLAIAAALSDVDALLAKLDQLIAKKRDLKQAAMQQLLTGKIRLHGFTESWDEKPLGWAFESLDAGVSVNSTEADTGAQVDCILKTSAVVNGRFLPDERKKIAPQDIHRAKLNPLRDTLLISRMNTPDLVGECGYVDGDYPRLFLPDRLWMTRIRSDADVVVRWLGHLLSSTEYKQKIKAAATGTSGSMKNLAKEAFLSLSVGFPCAEEQTAIATILSDMDTELAALETRRTKTRELKQGMMQTLLTGRIRLT